MKSKNKIIRNNEIEKIITQIAQLCVITGKIEKLHKKLKLKEELALSK